MEVAVVQRAVGLEVWAQFGEEAGLVGGLCGQVVEDVCEGGGGGVAGREISLCSVCSCSWRALLGVFFHGRDGLLVGAFVEGGVPVLGYDGTEQTTKGDMWELAETTISPS